VKHEPVEEVVPPGVVVGGYRVEKKLGAGGQGKVYLAWRDGRPYALKFIHLARVGEWGWRELFILLRHKFPNVVRLLSHVEWPEDQPEFLVLVMEYVRGRTLHRWAQEENPCARVVAVVLWKLARALAKVHAAEVLHRDLKDDNVLVREADGEPVLVDFGAGGMPGAPRVTRGALAPGDLHFRSPESVAFFLRESREPGERYHYCPADELYALGVILYALLTDTYPIDDAEPLMLAEILTRQPVPPHEVNERVPRALSVLCMRLLEKQPTARLASAGALCEALEEVLKEAKGDAAWEVPLFRGWDEDGSSEEALGDAAQPAWLRRWVRQKPRRGKRPAPAEPSAPGPLPPALPTPTTVPLTWPAAMFRHADVLASLLKAAVMLGVLVLAGLGTDQFLQRWWRPEPTPPASSQGTLPLDLPWTVPTWADGVSGEVAPRWKPPEADRAAAPPPAEATPAAAAPLAAPSKDNASVKKPQKTPRPQVGTKQKGLGAVVRGACAGLVGAALQACTGGTAPQVRPTPAPVECPADWKASHERLVIRSAGETVVLQGYEGENTERAPVREGPLTVVLGGDGMGKLPRGALLSGTLQLGESRFYGTFTRAQIPGGDAYPVCLVIGLEVPSAMPGGPACPAGLGDCPAHESRPGNVKMFTRFDVFPKGSSYQGGFF
jgi:serine/threonine-protein kinase